MAVVGYIRVSSQDQNTLRQLDGVVLDKRFEEKLSGKNLDRPELKNAQEYCREGDTFIVHSMDRLARSLVDLLKVVKDLTQKGVAVRFHKENLTFTGEDSPMSTLMLSIMGSVAEFERSMIRERQMEGIAKAKEQGKYKGRKPVLTAERVMELKAEAAVSTNKVALAKKFGISRASLYSYLKE